MILSTKSRVLEQLEQRRGHSVSGESMAAALAVSRNAVWKAIQELRRDGYQLIAVNRKGYCLSEDNDILSPAGIKPFLSDVCLPYADQISVFPVLPSTNQTAKEMAVAGAPHGTVIVAEGQTAGRGRYARPFFSPAGDGLYISLVLRPEKLRFENPTVITAFAAVAVCEAIEAVSGKTAQVKWVNDIFLSGKKAAGILTEAAADFESGQLGWIVLGIGMNISIAPESFPAELQSLATSVFPGGAPPGARNRLAAELINRLLGRERYPKEQDILSAYKSRLMMLNREVTVFQGEKSFRATALDIDSLGRLLVRKPTGEALALSAGEIRLGV